MATRSSDPFSKYEDYASREEPTGGLDGKREALVDDLYIHIVPDSLTRVTGLLSGEYDGAIDIPVDSAEQVSNAADSTLESTPRNVFNLYFNNKEGFF